MVSLYFDFIGRKSYSEAVKYNKNQITSYTIICEKCLVYKWLLNIIIGNLFRIPFKCADR